MCQKQKNVVASYRGREIGQTSFDPNTMTLENSENLNFPGGKEKKIVLHEITEEGVPFGEAISVSTVFSPRNGKCASTITVKYI